MISERYDNKLKSFSKLNRNDYSDFQKAEISFHQDGVTAHTARQSMKVVRELFPVRLISLFGGDHNWSTRSPEAKS